METSLIAAIIPALNAETMVEPVARETCALFRGVGPVFVVDDGSSDATAAVAERAGASVLRHGHNRGKGAAIRTGLEAAYRAGARAAVTLDADGQHPPREALRLARLPLGPVDELVLGIRDLEGAGAPRTNQVSNRISNFFLSWFSQRPLSDTQCGLRRYPLPITLSIEPHDDGYAFEAEIILRAIAAGVPLREVMIDVVYPPEEERLSHFHVVRDPSRIVRRVVSTLWETRGLRRLPRRAGLTAPTAVDVV